jgi:serine protease AprX
MASGASKYFIRFPESNIRVSLAKELEAYQAMGSFYWARTDALVAIAQLEDITRQRLEREGCQFFENVQFETFASDPPDGFNDLLNPEMLDPSLSGEVISKTAEDVLKHINAIAAWDISRGKDVTIAVIDTGVEKRLEFPAWKRSPVDLPSFFLSQHWEDGNGHGTMCAAIACATNDDGGRYNGVAPDATLISGRSTLRADDLYQIYEQLILWYRSGQIRGPLVISNSYGFKTCVSPHSMPEDHPYAELLSFAIDSGIVVVFAAGNNHYDVCRFDPSSDHPNTIWSINSLDTVLCVSTVDVNNSNCDSRFAHVNSSRGPGQWANQHCKPDCVAPTYGEILWRGEYLWMPWWGTSGACPQVAGLAALLLSVSPSMTPAQVADAIRNSCQPLNASTNCVGHGLIDCAAALRSIQ